MTKNDSFLSSISHFYLQIKHLCWLKCCSLSVLVLFEPRGMPEGGQTRIFPGQCDGPHCQSHWAIWTVFRTDARTQVRDSCRITHPVSLPKMNQRAQSASETLGLFCSIFIGFGEISWKDLHARKSPPVCQDFDDKWEPRLLGHLEYFRTRL